MTQFTHHSRGCITFKRNFDTQILTSPMTHQHRQLVAILFTDIVGYTAMMQQNEGEAVVVVKRYVQVLQTAIASHGGKILNDYGDGSLCSFSSATQALRCAIEIQQEFQNTPKVPLRIGLHVGEIFF